MGKYDLVLQELHQRRTELLQLMDEFEAGQQEDQSLAEAWKDELSRVEQEISEFEERNRQQQPPFPTGGSGSAPKGT
jgi:transcription elongation GreA/GreB family factor